MHIDLFTWMKTSLGIGDLRVRMLGGWENFAVHQRTFRAPFQAGENTLLYLLALTR